MSLAVASCGTDLPRDGLTGQVTDTAHEPVPGATLYAIPAQLVTATRPTASDLIGPAADHFDEPLEGLIAAMGETFPRVVTDRGGYYFMALPPGSYYLYVAPDPADPLHLPGGSAARRAQTADELLAEGRLDIKLSSQPSSFAPDRYIGSGTCIGCHPDHQGWVNHAHANGIHEPGRAAALQSAERIARVDAETLGKFAADTTLYFYDFDPARGDDKFKIQEGGTPPATTEFAYRLFQSGDDYLVEFQNSVNAALDPIHGQTFKIGFLYGGLIYKQRFISRLDVGAQPPTTSSAYFIFPPAQLQPGGTTAPPLGSDRTRWPWLDVRAANFWDTTRKLFKVPPLTESFDAQCSACHFTGFSIDAGTLESTAFESPGGIPWKAADRRVEGNLGCEVCHGPGREHMEARSRPGQFIVEPAYLAAERMMAICGQCHSRPAGNDSLGVHSQPPLDAGNRMMPPGGSRTMWRAAYVIRPDGNPKTDFWDGGLHSKLNRQQYSDMRKSTKYANPRILVTCTDCHDVHGGHTDPAANPRGLVATDNSLCQRCHPAETLSAGRGASYHELHQLIGSLRPEVEFRCVNCHMDQIGKTGVGRLGGATGSVQYFENDITDHTFVVPRKDDPGVATHTQAEAALGKAMPIPYTRSCSNCHVLDTVAFKP
ncbi:MAG TPA: cytochrome c3 family protein [Kofleriaceae bacterium]|nr:cytochrome c3 family protein [Kofleriaceae bacterium]